MERFRERGILKERERKIFRERDSVTKRFRDGDQRCSGGERDRETQRESIRERERGEKQKIGRF